VKIINKSEIRFLSLLRLDNVGVVFEWDGKIFRGIYPEWENKVIEFLNSSFYDELLKNNLFPESRITEYSVEGYDLVIEHKKITPVVFPSEYTFEMLKDIALLVLNVAKLAIKHGYNMKDCHYSNVLFDKNCWKYIDLGTFFQEEKVKGWIAYDEFIRCYYYPLVFFHNGLGNIAKTIISSMMFIDHGEYLVYKYRLLKYLSSKFLYKLIMIWRFHIGLSVMSDKKVCAKVSSKPKIIQVFVILAKKIINTSSLVPTQNINKIEKKILKVSKKEQTTLWKEYHSSKDVNNHRYKRITEIIKLYCSDAKLAIDIGGNQGNFSSLLLKNTQIEQVVCQDSDMDAIGKGYERNKEEKQNIIYANYTFLSKRSTLLPMQYERFKSDLVIAMALMHHLILSQGHDINDFFKELVKYTNKYVIVEFMPLGLWTSGSEVNTPYWYTLEWFKENFNKYFMQINKEEKLEENRIIFIGQVNNHK
jgi:hypothetical protein